MGDMVSANVVMSDEANREIVEYLNRPQSMVDTQKRLIVSAGDNLTKASAYNMTQW